MEDEYYIEPIGDTAQHGMATAMETFSESLKMGMTVYFGNHPDTAHLYRVPKRAVRQFENSQFKLFFYKLKYDGTGNIQFLKNINIFRGDISDEREALVQKASELPTVK